MANKQGATLDRLALITDGETRGDGDRTVLDVVHDSAQASSDAMFVAIKGFSRDGHDFVQSAVDLGAAVCVERTVEAPDQLVVSDTRALLGPIAAEVHGMPSRACSVVGVTGTNGKTMVTHFLESIVAASGSSAGVVGTLGARIAGEPVELSRTTPEASDLQRLLARMVNAGVDVAAIEVSSHALALHRVTGTRFEVVAFTNLGRDHLDFHGDLDGYFATKAELFTPEFAERAVIWNDDEWGRRLIGQTQLAVTSVGWEDSDVVISDIAGDLAGSQFTLGLNGAQVDVAINIGGRFNVANAAMAATIASTLDIDTEAILAGLSGVGSIPGRFELLDIPQPYAVVVDYAHTPEGVLSAINTARQATSGRVIALVGAGGDRDRTKRSEMGRAASTADIAVLTSDNPRSEDPAEILAEVAEGASSSNTIVEVDRRAAIRAAFVVAEPGDVVLLLGKGHETYQDIAGRLEPFDDREVARQEAST
ncbi:MAG: UDP-N-acetylmuramoyl-L-alanyl-D-glutamate--2,6-diaminopimelate ligase [Acidimicrobiia bacterium]|nr:UDP-N-acetylmuramoyl-L-alanyl-D-glutamate--2,6-diaminopimelate ligase [Acidimicrobiia bacterium]